MEKFKSQQSLDIKVLGLWILTYLVTFTVLAIVQFKIIRLDFKYVISTPFLLTSIFHWIYFRRMNELASEDNFDKNVFKSKFNLFFIPVEFLFIFPFAGFLYFMFRS